VQKAKAAAAIAEAHSEVPEISCSGATAGHGPALAAAGHGRTTAGGNTSGHSFRSPSNTSVSSQHRASASGDAGTQSREQSRQWDQSQKEATASKSGGSQSWGQSEQSGQWDQSQKEATASKSGGSQSWGQSEQSGQSKQSYLRESHVNGTAAPAAPSLLSQQVVGSGREQPNVMGQEQQQQDVGGALRANSQWWQQQPPATTAGIGFSPEALR
jgi:hypothetical protein